MTADLDPAAALLDVVRRAVADPGAVLPRGEGHAEPMPAWQARAVVDALSAAGLAVVELPEAASVTSYTDGYREARYGGVVVEVAATGPWIEYGGVSFRDPGAARAAAAALLAAAEWAERERVERLRAQHRVEHDGSGPPMVDPCSPDCRACAAEQGGEPR